MTLDEQIHELLSELAGIDTYDVNLRDQPKAYELVTALVYRARLEGYNTAMVWHGRSAYQAKNYEQIKGGWKDE